MHMLEPSGINYYNNVNIVAHTGKELLYRELKKAIASGVVDDTKAVGVLDQWLIEGKCTEEEALVLSCDLLAAGMETISIIEGL